MHGTHSQLNQPNPAGDVRQNNASVNFVKIPLISPFIKLCDFWFDVYPNISKITSSNICDAQIFTSIREAATGGVL